MLLDALQQTIQEFPHACIILRAFDEWAGLTGLRNHDYIAICELTHDPGKP